MEEWELSFHLVLFWFMKFWDFLLMKWRQSGKSGFTIPYLIGVLRLVEKRELKVVDLLEEMASQGSGGYFIRPCLDLSSDIIERYDDFLINGGERQALASGLGIVAIHNITSENLKMLYPNSSDPFDALGEKYEYEISHGLYSAHRVGSRDGASYAPFGDHELQELNELYINYSNEK